jgi:hypothetical protein
MACPERLRVFRQDPESGLGVPLPLAPEDVAVVDFRGGAAVAFPITSFGAYGVALDLDR